MERVGVKVAKQSEKAYNKLAEVLGFKKSLFQVDHFYIISDSQEYIFSYVGKEGIHHVFREIRGGWTRTYTDYQLIGKTVKEIGNDKSTNDRPSEADGKEIRLA